MFSSSDLLSPRSPNSITFGADSITFGLALIKALSGHFGGHLPAYSSSFSPITLSIPLTVPG